MERNGQLIAMSMLSGFGSALSDIFRPVAITTVNTEPGDSTLFQNPDTTEALEAGVASGFSDALERIADYYLQRAEEIFPVIEIDAGIRVDFIILKGTGYLL